MSWQELIDNRLEGLDAQANFAAIIGANPSKGARSPLLWNAAFAAIGRDTQMHPIDVKSAGLAAVLEGLASDPRFIGGAVTMPHKETTAAWLGPKRLSPEAARIGAVNCLYRDQQGTLLGTNTDGEGALVSLQRIAGSVAGKSVMLLGPGGAGKAVAAYLAGAGAQVTLAARDPQRSRDFAEKIGSDVIAMSAAPDALSGIDILVNCSSVGFAQNDPNASPLDASALATLPSHAVVFDIIYDPDPTVLLARSSERGLTVLNGGPMNLEQAILGFCYASPDADAKSVSTAMQGAR